ncbi:MAG: HD domain-containing protein [Planctomycetes bacterium]|nr:HD domain-containing protein [Planctomycetota bacterium]
MSQEELEILRRRAERDRRARERAEALLEAKARDLYDANERLRLATTGRLESLVRVSDELGRLQDLDILMNRVLLEARTLVGATAGILHVPEEGELLAAVRQRDEGSLPSVSPDCLRAPMSMHSVEGAVAMTGSPVNLADARHPPDNVPYRFNPGVDRALGMSAGPMLCIAVRNAASETVAVLQVVRDQASGATRPFSRDDEMMLRHFAGLAGVAIDRARLTRSIINRMIRAVQLRDPFETAMHAEHVADLSVELWRAWAERCTIHPMEIERSADRLRIAARLHDAGKVGVSDAILKKPARLTPREQDEVRKHVIIGAQLFDTVETDFDRHARDVALYHHAWWNGGGYPSAEDLAELRREAPRAAGPVLDLRGEGIPLFARIVAIADVYDALLSPRVYKKAWSVPEALEAIRTGAGSQFDPALAELFPEVVRRVDARGRQSAA